jgi:hypothetical protein
MAKAAGDVFDSNGRVNLQLLAKNLMSYSVSIYCHAVGMALCTRSDNNFGQVIETRALVSV